MKFTRILALILAFAAPLTLAACGEDVAETEIEDGEVEVD
jgi:hypothetical protein